MLCKFEIYVHTIQYTLILGDLPWLNRYQGDWSYILRDKSNFAAAIYHKENRGAALDVLER